MVPPLLWLTRAEKLLTSYSLVESSLHYSTYRNALGDRVDHQTWESYLSCLNTNRTSVPIIEDTANGVNRKKGGTIHNV